jgi:hypothetical protein
MGEYRKTTKEDINFPLFCLLFIKRIQKAIDKWDEGEYFTPIVAEMKIPCPYCSEAFKLIEKTFERQGLIMSPPTYTTSVENGIKYYKYKLKFSYWAYDEYSGLPF